MVVIEVTKIRIFRQNEGELARNVPVYEGLGGGRDESVILNGCWTFWDKSENFARIKIALFELH